jgi:hypothetical protein
LRTVFGESGGVPFQRVLGEGAGAGLLEVVAAGDAGAVVVGVAGRPFDLARELPVRAVLAVGGGVRVLVVVVHHIAADGWSEGPLLRDLSAAYAARVGGGEPSWPVLPVQYVDYALWQREVLGGEGDPGSELSRQAGFWKGVLAGLPEEVGLPADRPRPAELSYRGGTVGFEVPAGLHAVLEQVALRFRVTLFMVVQAALAGLLSRLGAGVDVPVGTVVAGRGDVALDELVGFFVNTLVLRTDVSGDPSFGELVGRVREADLAAFANQDVPFERVVEVVAPVRSLGRHPLFQVMLAFEGTGAAVLDLGAGVRVSPVAVPGGSAKFDLSFSCAERRGPGRVPAGVAGELEYAADLFDESSARDLAGRLVWFLDQVAADPELRVSQVAVVTEAERARLLGEWNDTGGSCRR